MTKNNDFMNCIMVWVMCNVTLKPSDAVRSHLGKHNKLCTGW